MTKLPKGIDVLPSGKFRVRIHPFPSKSFTRLPDAHAHREKLILAKQTGRIEEVDADLIKLRELAVEHMNAVGDSLEVATKNQYSTLWRAHVLTHAIADMPIRMISPQVVEDFQDDLKARKVGPTSIAKTVSIMHTVLQRGKRFHGLQGDNPAAVVKKPSRKRKRAVKVILPAEVEKMRARLKGADALMVSILAYTGMRPGEALALTWGDFKYGGNRKPTVNIDKATDPNGDIKATKTEEHRTPRLLAPLRDELKAYRAALGNPADDVLIFAKADGSAWTKVDWGNWRERKFKKAKADAKVAVDVPYDLRHSAASLWLFDGFPEAQVSGWMGHSIATLRGVYTHAFEDFPRRKSAADLIREARGHDKPVTKARVKKGQEQSTRKVSRKRRRASTVA